MAKTQQYSEPKALAKALKACGKGKKRVLGVDLGTNCGMAIADITPGQPITDAIIFAGQLDLSLAPYDTGPTRFIRLKQFLNVVNPDIVGFEDVKYTPAGMGGGPVGVLMARVSRSAELLGGLKVVMTTWAEENEIPLYTFPNFQNLIKASELEKKIDLVKVRDGSASAEEMNMYNEYIEATRDLNVNELFKEEPLLEDVLQDTLAETYDQKKLIRVSNALAIMKNLLRIKVVPEEYKYFTENKKDFDPKFWSNFLKEKSQELNLSLTIPENYFIISDNLSNLEEFYGIAFKRDKIFVKMTEEHLKNEGVDLAALVAGGFHTPTLTKLLADKGYSYIVISPKVTTETDDEHYRWTLKME